MECPDVPQDVPSLIEIKRILPKRCFQPILLKSLYYVLKDLVIISVLYSFYVTLEGTSAKYFCAPIYWYLQGTMFWAIFVLGHDCGHGSFSKYNLLNDVIGTFLHSLILVPYYPWKLSHRHHHKNTGNIDKDEIFYPVREGRDEKKSEKDCQGRGKGGFVPFFGLGFGWFYYLARGYSPRKCSHINPMDGMFVKNVVACCISILCCVATVVSILAVYARIGFGLTQFFVHYLAPVFGFGSWLVVTTFLHHQDEGVPWYANDKWDFVRGQLSSVDRHYGWAHDLVHNIGTHQIHHLFTKIPHYYLEDATAAFRAHFPHLVRFNDKPILADFCKMFFIFNTQHWIPLNKEVHVYRSQKSN